MKFIENVDKDKYIEFTDNHPKSHFLQSYAWGEFCRKIKGQIPYYVGMNCVNTTIKGGVLYPVL